MTRLSLARSLLTSRRMPAARGGVVFTAMWLVLTTAVLLGVRAQAWRHVAVWTLPFDGLIEPLMSALAGVAFMLLLRNASARGGASAPTVVALACLCYGPFALALRYANLTWSHVEVFASPLLGIALALVPHVATSPRVRSAAAGILLLVVTATGVAGNWSRLTGAPSWFVVRSSLHDLRIDAYPSVSPKPRVTAGGAIEALGDGYLLAAADGTFHRLAWDDGRLRSRRLALTLPMGLDALDAYQRAHGTIQRLRVTDIVVDRATDPPTLYVAHQYWDPERECSALRVSTTALRMDDAPGASWRTFVEVGPCLRFDGWYDSVESGGRLAWKGDDLLLTVGEFGTSRDGQTAHAQEPDSLFGKVLRVTRDGFVTPFTSGHRNPQGLFVDTEGLVWSTEQGPQGGDELNLLTQGANYGWPWSTYGTDSGSHEAAFVRTGRDHGEYTEPLVALVPSVGLSNLVRLRSSRFPRWNGDLLAGTLGGHSLLRIRVRDQRVILTEAMPIRYRIRDLVEDPSGRIVAWTDECDVLVITPDGEAP